MLCKVIHDKHYLYSLPVRKLSVLPVSDLLTEQVTSNYYEGVTTRKASSSVPLRQIHGQQHAEPDSIGFPKRA